MKTSRSGVLAGVVISLVLAACPGRQSGGQGSAGSAGSSAHADASASALRCPSGKAPRHECYSRQEMEAQARLGCSNVAANPAPTDAEITAFFLPNGCLPIARSCDTCCNPPIAEGAPQSDGSCCYDFCGDSCC